MLHNLIVVTEPEKRAALADLYRQGFETFLQTPIADAMGYNDTQPEPAKARVLSSINYLVEHLHQVPVHVIPCFSPRAEGLPVALQHAIYGSIAPAAWSFMLAARTHGLGTCWTIFHLYHEEEAANLLGISYEDVMQIALIPVAYSKGTAFKAGRRESLDTMVHWESW